MQFEKNASGLFSPTLYKIVKTLPPTPRKTPKVKKSTAPHCAVSDDTVLTILRRIKTGTKIPALAVEFGIKPNVITKWAQGLNRGHLLMQVEREM